MSNTPRTDERIGAGGCLTVPVNFARKLERELNAANAEIIRLSIENKELDRQVTLNRNNWAIDSEEKDRRHYKNHNLIRRMREILDLAHLALETSNAHLDDSLENELAKLEIETSMSQLAALLKETEVK